MKKKKKVLPRTPPEDGPRKVGGTDRGTIKVDWPKLGRTRPSFHNPVAEFGLEMKAVREANGISVAALAKKINVAPATMIKFEDRGHPVSILIVLKMAAALGYELSLEKRA